MGQSLVNDNFKEMDQDKYEESFENFDDFYRGEKITFKRAKEVDFEKKLNEKKSIDSFVEKLLESEKKEPILEEMNKIFQELKKNYDLNHKNDDDGKKSFLDNIDENKKNWINAIYISKNIIEDNDDFNIHDYAVYLYNEEEVKDIE